MDAKLRAFPLVDIDHQGRFKYILVRIFGKGPEDALRSKLIVRGTKRALWHCEYSKSNNLFFVFHCQLNAIFLFSITADIYRELSTRVQAMGLDSKCVGGGRIEHFPKERLLKVYGYSSVSI